MFPPPTLSSPSCDSPSRLSSHRSPAPSLSSQPFRPYLLPSLTPSGSPSIQCTGSSSQIDLASVLRSTIKSQIGFPGYTLPLVLCIALYFCHCYFHLSPPPHLCLLLVPLYTHTHTHTHTVYILWPCSKQWSHLLVIYQDLSFQHKWRSSVLYTTFESYNKLESLKNPKGSSVYGDTAQECSTLCAPHHTDNSHVCVLALLCGVCSQNIHRIVRLICPIKI